MNAMLDFGGAAGGERPQQVESRVKSLLSMLVVSPLGTLATCNIDITLEVKAAADHEIF